MVENKRPEIELVQEAIQESGQHMVARQSGSSADGNVGDILDVIEGASEIVEKASKIISDGADCLADFVGWNNPSNTPSALAAAPEVPPADSVPSPVAVEAGQGASVSASDAGLGDIPAAPVTDVANAVGSLGEAGETLGGAAEALGEAGGAIAEAGDAAAAIGDVLGGVAEVIGGIGEALGGL